LSEREQIEINFNLAGEVGSYRYSRV